MSFAVRTDQCDQEVTTVAPPRSRRGNCARANEGTRQGWPQVRLWDSPAAKQRQKMDRLPTRTRVASLLIVIRLFLNVVQRTVMHGQVAVSSHTACLPLADLGTGQALGFYTAIAGAATAGKQQPLSAPAQHSCSCAVFQAMRRFEKADIAIEFKLHTAVEANARIASRHRRYRQRRSRQLQQDRIGRGLQKPRAMVLADDLLASLAQAKLAKHNARPAPHRQGGLSTDTHQVAWFGRPGAGATPLYCLQPAPTYGHTIFSGPRVVSPPTRQITYP